LAQQYTFAEACQHRSETIKTNLATIAQPPPNTSIKK